MTPTPKFIGLSPIILSVLLVVVSGVVSQDFNTMPILVSLLLSSAYAFSLNPQSNKLNIAQKIDIFCVSAGNKNIILLAIIFLLAGAFYSLTIEIGARDATVNWALQYIPSQFLLPGLFIISSFIAFSMGTSMGTIMAITPVGIGLADSLSFSAPLAAGIVIGGAMFGDNLSFVSDTTIAATKTQGVKLIDKFKANILIVTPAAAVTILLLLLIDIPDTSNITLHTYNLWLVIPYFLVIFAALIGLNVMAVLGLGILSASLIGLIKGQFDIEGLLSTLQTGMGWMQNLAIIALTIGGIIGLMRAYGGMEWLMQTLTKRIRSKKSAEFSIASLASCMDIATSNNTIAIVSSGTIAKEISTKYNVDPRRSASILDIFSCGFQGLVPYGGQLLTAAVMCNVSPVALIKYCWYPALILVFGVLAIASGLPKFKSLDDKSKRI
ncbi:Na+/H+ antiporter NhaC family protein [Glaciecola petra]|uniref:Na+/H+ antiporter NhaC family protein n=1 Tax=Glaciecola petra TaxID=3075602 RepID=A0ABU2ZMX7_9ALTE|nr:Na+/H+ antiporter NhaC family protein [Aestuariibacter sp. P117]MDT0593965.1 Na+/H+ antiporter NhaC family protein [Aestuariibacter sp. P117]